MQYINTKDKRPLSPHLGIYKPQMSSVLSIMHRMSGVVNYIGMVVIIWWLVSIAFSPNNPTETWFWNFFGTTLGIFVVVAWSYSIFFHLCTGIRHLFWDIHIGFSIRGLHIGGWLALVFSTVFTIITWSIIYGILG